MPTEVKKYLNRNIQSQFDKDPAIQSGQVEKVAPLRQPAVWFAHHQVKHPQQVIDVDGRQIN